MAACLACLAIGWVANWLTRASVDAGCSLVSSVPVGQPIRVTAHLTHTGRLPALDTSVAFDVGVATRSSEQQAKRASKRATRRAAKRSTKRATKYSGHEVAEVSEPSFFALLRPGERQDYVAQLRFQRRGIHRLPPLVIESTFPFYLFRWRRKLDLQTEVAVTPIPLQEDQDQTARRVLTSVGNWAKKLLAGEASEYAGSREYLVGMTVRRWDFASWARLGKPIVREFKAPSVRSMNVIVDTADVSPQPTQSKRMSAAQQRQVDDSFEYLMSMSVSVLNALSGGSVTVQMFLADEMRHADDSDNRTSNHPADVGGHHLDDRISQLVRLAKSSPVDAQSADAEIQAVADLLENDPTLLLTRRPLKDFDALGGDIVICSLDEIDAPVNLPGSPSTVTKSPHSASLEQVKTQGSRQ